LDFELDPFSILVPFLVFAIGVSHGAQKLNGVIRDVGRGCHPYVAARYTFRALFLAGVTALLSDGVGFAVLMIIQIPVIQDLAITASIGVLVLIFTNLILVPIIFSYLGIGDKACVRAQTSPKLMHEMHSVWRFLLLFTERGPAKAAIIVSLILAAFGLYVAQDLKIGDLDPGAPELRPDSRYNKDVAFMIENYSVSTDVFAVIVKTPADGCVDQEGLSLANNLEWRLRQTPGVEDVRGLNVRTREIMMGINEGFPKWHNLFRNQDTINYAVNELVTLEYVDVGCSIWPMLVYLADHKAETLIGVTDTLSE
ncbi:MAG: MMPL family transporter, partial [Cellvibrionaceae bacterium]|nr:MMPL family transporter [Cellvibrionaceae bacterium]